MSDDGDDDVDVDVDATVVGMLNRRWIRAITIRDAQV